jgi:RimJ/RimL family protein N-acetyltransferase
MGQGFQWDSGFLETPRLRLRIFRVEDVPALHDAMAASIDHLGPWLDWAKSVPSRSAVESFVVNSRERASQGLCFQFGLFHDDVLVGCCQLDGRQSAPDFELGAWSVTAHQRNGFMQEAVSRICDFAFQQCGASRVFVKMDAANAPAIRGALRAGFAFGDDEGGDGRTGRPDEPILLYKWPPAAG